MPPFNEFDLLFMNLTLLVIGAWIVSGFLRNRR